MQKIDLLKRLDTIENEFHHKPVTQAPPISPQIFPPQNFTRQRYNTPPVPQFNRNPQMRMIRPPQHMQQPFIPPQQRFNRPNYNMNRYPQPPGQNFHQIRNNFNPYHQNN